MLSDAFPPAARVVAAAVCLGLAWWAFGRRPAPGEPDRRRPGLVALAAAGGGWLLIAGDAWEWLTMHGGRWWIPTTVVGVLGTIPLLAKRGSRHVRRWAGPVAGLMIVAPFVASLFEISQTERAFARLLAAPTGFREWEIRYAVAAGFRAAAVSAVTGLLVVAAWPRPAGVSRDEPPVDEQREQA
ncbi:hypothetical protein [Alienimonas chondri]|uniref:Uncharacterized protein n=1 Tax=Alienimonas chondri TaxID=2681879 RepID=A0ABX1VCV8_9PLAN|nr:hypothetical protein [Alienimonas chondri]NNJ25796.1 hypothetical protein [Alienimonas chondri]